MFRYSRPRSGVGSDDQFGSPNNNDPRKSVWQRIADDIDTGTTPSMLDSQYAKDLGTPLSTGQMDVAVGTNIHTSLFKGPRFAVGKMMLASEYALIGDLTAFEKKCSEKLDGLLGIDLLTNTAFGLDFDRKTVSFGATIPKNTHDYEIVPLLPCEAICLNAEFEGGITIPLLLDSGFSTAVGLDPESWDLLFSQRTNQAIAFSSVMGIGQTEKQAVTRLSRLRVGTNEYHNLLCARLEDPSAASRMGAKAEQRLRVIGLKPSYRAGAPGKPGGNTKASKRSWVKLDRAFQTHLAATNGEIGNKRKNR